MVYNKAFPSHNHFESPLKPRSFQNYTHVSSTLIYFLFTHLWSLCSSALRLPDPGIHSDQWYDKHWHLQHCFWVTNAEFPLSCRHNQIFSMLRFHFVLRKNPISMQRFPALTFLTPTRNQTVLCPDPPCDPSTRTPACCCKGPARSGCNGWAGRAAAAPEARWNTGRFPAQSAPPWAAALSAPWEIRTALERRGHSLQPSNLCRSYWNYFEAPSYSEVT